MEEEAPEDFRNGEDEMTIRHCLQHMLTEPLAEFHDPFLMAGGAEVAPLTTERQQKVPATGLAHKPGKTSMQVATFKIPADDLLEVRPPEAVALRKSFFVDPLKGIKVVLDTLIEGSQVWLSRSVDRAGFGHGGLSTTVQKSDLDETRVKRGKNYACPGSARGRQRWGNRARPLLRALFMLKCEWTEPLDSA